MEYWEMVFEAYKELVMAAQLAQQECIALIGERRFQESKKIGQSRDGYYECAQTAIGML